jgi:methionyl-tRNA synthetase
LWAILRKDDEILTREQPWKLADIGKIKDILQPIAQDILNVGILLRSLLPDTSEKIINMFNAENIKKGESLFPRI